MMTTFNKSLFSLIPLLIILLSLGGINVVSSHKTCDPVFFQFFLKVHPDCTVERLLPANAVPPTFDQETQVQASDAVVHAKTQLHARLYRPTNIEPGTRVPVLVYFHGGGFVAGSPFAAFAQRQLFRISSLAKVVIVSVDYVLAPEHKIPIPYRNGDKTLKWVSRQSLGKETNPDEQWFRDIVDFDRVFVGGQSAGGNIAYNVALRFQQHIQQHKRKGVRFAGLVLMDPYFLSTQPLPSLLRIPENFRNNVTRLWNFVCPRSVVANDPRVNPYIATNLGELNPGRVLICVAEKDPMIDTVKAFYTDVLEKAVAKTELYETFGKGHSFDNIFPNAVETDNLYKKIASFIQEK